MAVSDRELEPSARAARGAVPDAPPGVLTAPVSWHHRFDDRFGVGLVVLVIGVATTWLTLELVTAQAGLIKYVLVGVGVALAFRGLTIGTRWAFGPTFDLGLWLSTTWLGLLVLSAIFADLLPLAESREVSKTLSVPARLRPDLLSLHPLGTDSQGLDVLGGIVYGGRVSLIVGLGSVGIGVAVGLVVGIVAGYFRGKTDAVVSVLTDSMLAFPALILLLGLVSVVGASVKSVTLGLAIISIPTFIRFIRVNTMVISQREFILSARAIGERQVSIMTRELLPNVLVPVVGYALLVSAIFIVAEASLSFLGLSVTRPNPTWGNMVAAGQDKFSDHPHVVFIPGAVLFATVFSLNRVAERARRTRDTRESKI